MRSPARPSLVGILVSGVLALCGCRKQPADKPVVKAAAPRVPEKPVPAPVRQVGGRPIIVPQRALLSSLQMSGDAELVFSAAQPLVAERTKEGCDVWNIEASVYVGRAPRSACADWLPTCAQLPSTDRLKTPPAGCSEISVARTSPDGQQIALTCKDDSHVYVHDARSGARTSALDLDPLGPKVALRELCWGPRGLTVMASPRIQLEDCGCWMEELAEDKATMTRDYVKGDVCQAGLAAAQRQVTPPAGVSLSIEKSAAVVRAASGSVVKFSLGDKAHPCTEITHVRFRPDGERIFIRCDARSSRGDWQYYLGDLRDGTLVSRTQPRGMSSDEDDEVGWYRDRLQRIQKLRGPSDFLQCDVGQPNEFAAVTYHFSSPTEPPVRAEHGDTSPGHQFLLDPRGRYLFMPFHAERAGFALYVRDLTSGTQTDLSWGPVDRYSAVSSELRPSRWLPGKHPVWETIDVIQAPNGTFFNAWRIGTAPDQHGLQIVALEEQEADTKSPDPRAAPAIPDGGSASDEVSPDGLWVGLGKDSLRRRADGEEIFLGEDGTARTGRGVFDGPIDLLDTLVFRLSEDPRQGPFIHGDQLARLLHHPGLVNDFFAGKRLYPDAYLQPLGLPPRLELVSVRAAAPQVLFTVRASDGGDGVASLWRYVEGKVSGGSIGITAGTPIEVGVPQPTDGCAMIRLYACNRLGYVCSKAVRHDFCPPGHQRPRMDAP